MSISLLSSPNDPFSVIQSLLSDTGKAYLTSPYVKESFIKRILPQLEMVSDVRLLTRLTSYEISTNSVDLSALDLIAQFGEVRCLSTLHAKSILTELQAYVGSFNFTHSAFFRNFELGVILDDPLVLQGLESYFLHAWQQATPLAKARRDLQVDQVVLRTIGWQKVREWWDIISNVNLQEYNPIVSTIVLLPMPKPPVDRPNTMIRALLDLCNERSNVETVLFSELYGPIPFRFADQFGETGEYFFDEPAENFYSGKELSKEGHKAARIFAKFIQRNLHSQLVAPLPDNYRRLCFLKAAEEYSGASIIVPRIQAPVLGYIRGVRGAVSFLNNLLT
jgi:hypothetical protein